MHKFPLISVLLLSSAPFFVRADEPAPSPYAGKAEMNGYKLKDYEGFEKKWKLVTVRYRKDTGEMRLTYANDLAWKSLKAGVKEYPNGSVFAKIGLKTNEDPAFTSSAVPSGARRFQFMVRNTARHKETDGWGYALFDAKGLTFPEEPKLASIACHACHRLVPERNFVFSQPFDLSTTMSGKLDQLQAAHPPAPRLTFALSEVAALGKDLQEALGEEFKQISLVEGEMRRNLFQGTLDEIKPSLAKKAAETGLPAALVSEDGTRFSVVFPPREDKSCAAGRSSVSLMTTVDAKEKVRRTSYCAGGP